ncbi:MAG TPA: transketolase [Firmicutes bacterium]|jgi:transketolase|nr:transketolase [Bacillota bacterium]
MAIDLTSDVSTRKAFSEAITEFGLKDERVFSVAADSESRFGAFRKEAADRAINVGIAEQNAMSIAAGLAFCGKIPFISTYATFLTMRACEQIRTDIAFANLNVRIVGTNVGFSSDWLGMTHQALEDVALMRSIPNMTVLAPADGAETYRLVEELINYEGPAYLRIRGTAKEPHVSSEEPIVIGKARKIRDGNDLTIIACGRLVYEAMLAADRLAQEGIRARVLDLHTLKPLDEEAVLKAATETQRILTVEEHSIIGGLGSAVAELTSTHYPVTVRRMGIKDRYGIPGKEEDLFAFFGLTSDHIFDEAHKLLETEESL